MANNTTIPPEAILNPYTPLAFLPPHIADQYQAMCYMYVTTLSAYSWDWLMSLPEEYKAFRKVGFRPPHIAYLASRFASLGFCISTTTFMVAPLPNCAALRFVEGAFFEVAVPATSLLFFFRVKAIYNHSRYITAFFGIIWLAIAGVSILIMLGITGERIPYTRRCREGLAHTYTTVPIMLTGVNDTLVFLAISYRMVSISMVNSTWSARARSFIRGDGLHHLSKALLQSGQVYYAATIGVAIAATALILAPGVPTDLHPILGSAYFALSSAMACRVFRAVLLGNIQDPPLNPAAITSVVRAVRVSDEDYDTSGRLSKLKINVAVEMDRRTDSCDEHVYWEPGDDVGKDASHGV